MDEDFGNSLKTLAKGAGIMYIGTFLSKAIMYLYRIVVAREDIGLGPEAYGLLSIGLAVFWVSVSLSHLGFGGGIQRRVTEYLGRGEEGNIPTVLATSVLMTFPLSLLIAALLFLFSPQISTLFFHDPSLEPVLRMFALAVPFQILYKNGAAYVKAFREMKYIAVTDKIFRSLFTLIVTVALIYAGYGVMGAVVAQLGAIAFSALLIMWFAERKVRPFLQRTYDGMRSEGSELFHYSWPLFLSGIVGLFVGWTDTFLLGFFDTSKGVGIYNAALPTAQLITVISVQMTAVLFPTVSEFYGKGEKERAEDVASIAIKWMYLAALPGFVLMAVFSRQILKLLFGNVYTVGSVALSVLAAAYFVKALTAHANSFIKSEEWTKLAFLNSVIISGMNVGLNMLLIPMFIQKGWYGPTGAAVATATSLAFGGILATVEAYYFFDIQPYRYGRLVPATIATAVSAVSVYALLHFLFDPVPPLMLIPAFLLFAALYFALFLLLGGVEESDLEVLRAVDRKTPADLEPLKKIFRRLKR